MAATFCPVGPNMAAIFGLGPNSSRLLTTFVTPFGRYHLNKLPFCISSASELFQKRMSNILSGLKRTLCLLDDVLIFGKTQEEHDQRLAEALIRIQSAGVTLNKDKCVFNTSTLTFLGHVLVKDGISADPEKTSAALGICQNMLLASSLMKTLDPN